MVSNYLKYVASDTRSWWRTRTQRFVEALFTVTAVVCCQTQQSQGQGGAHRAEHTPWRKRLPESSFWVWTGIYVTIVTATVVVCVETLR